MDKVLPAIEQFAGDKSELAVAGPGPKALRRCKSDQLQRHVERP